MDTENVSTSPSLFRHLVRDNPMTLEATRVWRRFIRSGGDLGKGVNVTGIGFVVILYVWCLAAIIRCHEEMSAALLALELVLLTLLVPGSMYAAVSGERERLTWDSLIMTSLSPGQIVAGKLLWRVVLILGAAVLFLPPLLLSYHNATLMTTGHPEYTLPNLFLAQGLNISWAFLLAGFSLLVSTKTKRTTTTLAIVTITILVFLALVPMLVGLFGGHSNLSGGDPPLMQLGALLQHLNPLDGLTRLSGELAGKKYDYWTEQWTDQGMMGLLPLVYLGGASACVIGAWKTLRGLEEPRVRS